MENTIHNFKDDLSRFNDKRIKAKCERGQRRHTVVEAVKICGALVLAIFFFIILIVLRVSDGNLYTVTYVFFFLLFGVCGYVILTLTLLYADNWETKIHNHMYTKYTSQPIVAYKQELAESDLGKFLAEYYPDCLVSPTIADRTLDSKIEDLRLEMSKVYQAISLEFEPEIKRLTTELKAKEDECQKAINKALSSSRSQANEYQEYKNALKLFWKL